MNKRKTLWSAATIAGLLLGTAVAVPAQQNRQQDQAQRDRQEQTQRSQQDRSQRSQSQQTKLQLPGAESIIEIDADVPSELRIGEQADYQIRVRNVSDNVAMHDLKLKIQSQQGMTLEQVQLQQQDQQQQNQQQQNQNQQQNQQEQNQLRQDQEQQRNQPSQDDQQQREQRQQQQQGSQTDAQQQSPESQDGSRPSNQRRDAQQSNQESGQSEQSQQATGEQPERESDGSYSVTIAKLMPGETRTINVTATAEQEGRAQACVLVTQFSPALCLVTEAVKPELELVKTAPERASLCEPIEFEYFVKNSGSGDLGTFEVTDQLPEGLQTETGDDQLRFEVDGLEAGDTRKFVATLRATKGGEFSSRAVAKTGDGQTTRSSQVTTTVEEAQLAVAIDGPRSALIDSPATYQIRITNQGNIRADNVELVLQHPEIARFRGAGEFRETDNAVQAESGQSQPTAANQSQRSQQQQRQPQDQQQQDQQQQAQQRQDRQQADRPQQSQQQDRQRQAQQQQDRSSRKWELGTLEPGQTKQMTVTLLPTEADQIRATAVARYRCATSDRDWLQSQASTSTEVVSIPALLLSVIDDEEDRDDAGNVTYTIEIRNQGTAPDQQIQISATLPEGLEFVEGSGETEVTAEGQELQIAPLEELAPEEEAHWQIQARATGDQQQQLRFRVSLASQALDQQVVAEEPTTILPGTRSSARPSEISN